MASLKFGMGQDIDYVSPAKPKTENRKHLKELIEMDPDEESTINKIYNFKFNFIPVETDEKNIEGSGKTFECNSELPPFTTYFKANPKPSK